MRLDHWIKQLFILPGIGFALFMLPDTNIREEAGRILKKYHLTPGELDEILVKQEKEGKKLIEMERSLKGNETI